MSTCGRMHAGCQPVGETGLCVGHFHSSAVAVFFFSVLIAPLLLLAIFLYSWPSSFCFLCASFFLVRRCATAFKICTAFDILINHASRRMSHSRVWKWGTEGGRESGGKVSLIVGWTSSKAKWEVKQHLLSKSARSKRFKKEAANSDNRQQNWKKQERKDTKHMPSVKYPWKCQIYIYAICNECFMNIYFKQKDLLALQ